MDIKVIILELSKMSLNLWANVYSLVLRATWGFVSVSWD